jgi:lysophospholipase L1-like esterase
MAGVEWLQQRRGGTLVLALLLLVVFCASRGAAEAEEFDCERQPRTEGGPPGAEAVRPADVRAVAALGDSISAGFGMRANTGLWVDDAVEFRGLAFSTGGDSERSLPSLLEAVRPLKEKPLAGKARGTTLPLDFFTFRKHVLRRHSPDTDKFNAAMSGSYVGDIADKQTPYLVEQMQDHPWLDFYNDWKLITFETGSNNVLDACLDRPWSHPENFEVELESALRDLHSRIPNVFVNLMPIVNISAVHPVFEDHFFCRAVQELVRDAGCAALGTHEDLVKLERVRVAFNSIIYSVANRLNSELSGPRSNFTISVQPFMEDLELRNVLEVSGFDCFHPSERAHNVMAQGLWNNMLQAPGNKSRQVDRHNPTYLCPQETTVLR